MIPFQEEILNRGASGVGGLHRFPRDEGGDGHFTGQMPKKVKDAGNRGHTPDPATMPPILSSLLINSTMATESVTWTDSTISRGNEAVDTVAGERVALQL